MRNVVARLLKLEKAKLEAARDADAEADSFAPRTRCPWWPKHWSGCPNHHLITLESWQSRMFTSECSRRWFIDRTLPEGEFPPEMPWATNANKEAALGFRRAFIAVREGYERREAMQAGSGQHGPSPTRLPWWPKSFQPCPPGSNLADHQAREFALYVTRCWSNQSIPIGTWPPGEWTNHDRQEAAKLWDLRRRLG